MHQTQRSLFMSSFVVLHVLTIQRLPLLSLGARPIVRCIRRISILTRLVAGAQILHVRVIDGLLIANGRVVNLERPCPVAHGHGRMGSIRLSNLPNLLGHNRQSQCNVFHVLAIERWNVNVVKCHDWCRQIVLGWDW